MEFPGVSKKLIGELEDETQKAAKAHIKDVQAIVAKKSTILENKDPNEVFLQFKGFSKIDDYLKIIPPEKNLHEKLEELKAEVTNFKTAFDEEVRLVLDLKRLNEEAADDETLLEELESLKAEISNDLIIGVLVEDQVSALGKIHELCSDISHAASEDVQEYVSQLDSIISVLETTIKEERDVLELLYNILNIPGWRELYNATVERID